MFIEIIKMKQIALVYNMDMLLDGPPSKLQLIPEQWLAICSTSVAGNA